MTENINNNWGSLFERATEDISHYLWAVEQWEDESYEPHDLLLEIAFRRGRGKEALKILKECPEKYAKYRQTLQHMFEEAEDKFKPLIQKEGILEDVTKKISFLKNLLEEVRHNYEEEIIFEDSDLRRELEESGGRFLESFLRYHHLYKQLGDFSLSDGQENEYSKEFRIIEDNFRKLFYLFHPLKDSLNQYKEEAYLPINYWWLYKIPPEEAPNQQFVNQLINLGASRLQRQRAIAEHPLPEKLASYAFGEMSSTDSREIKSHLIKCTNCLKEVIELRQIDITTQIPSYEELKDIKVPDKILNALLPKPKDIPLGEWLGEGRQKIANFFRFIFFRCIEAFSQIYSGGSKLPAVSMGEEKRIYSIPQKVLHTIKKVEDKITLIEAPEEAKPELKPLAEALYNTHFYYCIFGIGSNNKLEEISKVQAKKRYDLPLGIDFKDLKGTYILWIIIHIEEEKIQKLYRSITDSLDKENISLPEDIDPVALLIVLIEPRE